MELKINYRKATVIILTLLCFWVAFERCRNFYIQNAPLGSVGECFNIQYPNFPQHYQMRILDNNLSDHSSEVEIKLLEGNGVGETNYTFAQMRMLSPKKMECK